MNASEIAWVSGWASDISVWEDSIYEKFPSFSHRFIDYYDLVFAEPDDIFSMRIAEAGIVVGWSMGTLALLRNLQKKAQQQKWILLCPIADFCAEGCWTASAVKATKQGILQNTEQTLLSFSELMGNIPREEREKWVENAMRYSPKQLAMGLDYMMQKKADISKPDSNIKLIFGEQDRIVPLAQKQLFISAGWQVKVCERLQHWIGNFADNGYWI
jgi:hypothetical protein